ncbi:MAG: IS4 family transposase [Symploca sp. SIO3C6]|nr:IS4 family transposase [Symploca sp. SIO3C6]
MLKQRWAQRTRPVAPSIAYGLKSFDHIWAADGSVLEALFRKLDSLKDVPVGQLAGKICTVIELGSQLPVEMWFHEDSKAHDCQFLDDLFSLAQNASKVLLVLDRGFYDFEWWRRLMEHSVAFIILGKSNLSYRVVNTLSESYGLTDEIIEVGTLASGPFQLRLISIRKGKGTYRYLTSVLDPHVLPPYVVADLYARRWRIEDAFHLVKRLLGLSYLWTGSLNGLQLQIWATWIMYAVLFDLSDAVADAVQLPLDRISPEMVWRGLYHFNTAYNKGIATDPIVYLAAPENRDLSVIKSLRKPLKILDLSPFPDDRNKPLTQLKNT